MKIIALIMIYLAMPSAYAGNIYHCKDSSGKMAFQDRPCSHKTVKVEVEQVDVAKPTEEELQEIAGIMFGIGASSVESSLAYLTENPGRTPPGCFDIEKNLHPYGRDLSIQGYQFRCMKFESGGQVTGTFQSKRLLSYCKTNVEDPDCEEWNEDMRAQFFKQL